MWQNYLTVGLRALARNKTQTIINVLGLTLGLASCLVILLYVRYETSFDGWLANSSRIYQLQTWTTDPNAVDRPKYQTAPFPAGTALAKDFPQIEAVTVAMSSRPVVIQNGQATEGRVLRADPNFFDVLELPFLIGDPKTALASMDALVLTEDEALKRFGRTDVIGEVLTISTWDSPSDLRVTGVLRKLPANTHLDLSLIARFNPADFASVPDALEDWGWFSSYVYARLRSGASADDINAQLGTWEKRNIPTIDTGHGVRNEGNVNDWQLVNIRDVHLSEAQELAMTLGNDVTIIYAFSIVAALILMMACVNFTNLATARAGQRAREVALRKVLGARRSQLVIQFLGESIAQVAFAMLLALAAIELLLPHLSNYIDAELVFAYLGEDGLLPIAIPIVLIVGFVGGLYPAFYLSRFRPSLVLKANKSSSDAAGSSRLRAALVIGQFAVSIGLVISTGIIYSQTLYALSSDPGFERDGLLQVSGLNRTQLEPVAEALTAQVRRIDGVTSASRSRLGVATEEDRRVDVLRPGQAGKTSVMVSAVEPSFFETTGIKLVAGRLLSQSFARDTGDNWSSDGSAQQALVQRGINVLINEQGARSLGFPTPQQAVGAQLMAGMVQPEFGMVPATIVGVVGNARFGSLRERIEPVIFYHNPRILSELLIRYDGNPAAVRADVEQVWKRFAPDAPFVAEFSSDLVAELYRSDEARGSVFAAFAILSLVIATLGLFGLAAFAAERRTKEIGIRKVLGAQVQDIMRLLVWDFVKPIVVANAIAWPVAWWLMRDWLNGFDDRIALGPSWFVGAGLLALTIGIITVGGHALRVARVNPVHALRDE